MIERISEASPRALARIAGISYLLDLLTSVPGDLLAGSAHVVPGDAAATAANVMAHEPLLRLGVAADLFATACYAAVTVVFYALFKVVNRPLARLTMFTSLTALAIWTSGSLSQLAATLALPGGPAGGPRAQLRLTFLEWNAHASKIGIVVFATYCLLIGYLIAKSTLLPRVLGILMMLGGLGLLAYLSPALADDLSPFNAVPALAGETSLMLWLLIKGVHVQRPEEMAPAAWRGPDGGGGTTRRA